MLTGPHSRQIHGWLCERITLEQAEAHYAALERDTLALLGTTGGWLPGFQKWIAEEMQAGDELWLYDSGPEAWVHLHGEKGIALVRDGQVLAHRKEFMN